MFYRTAPFAAAALLLLGACSINSNTDKARGAAGESCQSRDDCTEGLACNAGICGAPGAAAPDGSVPTYHSKEGESCVSRADCELGLACMNQVCVIPAPVQDAGTAVVAIGQRGESCRTNADCSAGLACLRNTCTLSEIDLTPTGNECVSIQCRSAVDCCGRDSQCKLTQQECQQGDQEACEFYNATCKCTESSAEQYECVDYQCKQKVTCNADAGIYYSRCSSQEVCDPATSKCVQCVKGTDCTRRVECVGKTCTCAANKCVPSCTTNFDCAGLQECKEGQCVKSACKTNRECIAVSGNLLSTCNKNTGECGLQCTTDAECNGGTLDEGVGGTSRFRVCGPSGSCEEIGCETKEECKILLRPSSVSSNVIDVDCLPKVKK